MDAQLALSHTATVSTLETNVSETFASFVDPLLEKKALGRTQNRVRNPVQNPVALTEASPCASSARQKE